jgi:hypothetical protein
MGSLNTRKYKTKKKNIIKLNAFYDKFVGSNKKAKDRYNEKT